MLKAEKKDIFTIPNILTYFRLILVPVFAVVFFLGGEYRVFIALAIFAVASFTDIIDGKIARKYNMCTMIGQIFDPLADKLLQVTALICMSIEGLMFWPFAILLLVKELYMIIGATILAKLDVTGKANKWGKLAATILGYSMIACFFHKVVFMAIAPWFYLDWLAVGVGLCVSIYAAYDYTIKAVKAVKTRGVETDNKVLIVDYTKRVAEDDIAYQLDENGNPIPLSDKEQKDELDGEDKPEGDVE